MVVSFHSATPMKRLSQIGFGAKATEELAWARSLRESGREIAAIAHILADAVSSWTTPSPQYSEGLLGWIHAGCTNRGRQDFGWMPSATQFENYVKEILIESGYPVSFAREIDLCYNQESKTLLVDYLLPPRTSIITLCERRLGKSGEVAEKPLPGKKLDALWDSLLYQVCLRSMFEIFSADRDRYVDAVVFNGWVRFVDVGTGHEKTACILSLQTKRDEFLALNLANVEPKACFKVLKGVGGSKLHGLSPIAPIMQIDRRDKRFISSYAVADSLDEGYNIAAMDWKDFEQLVREVLEKEFAHEGGEVKVTQASRDGGVDAVAFDPDPLRGGKIVIQAKRYTNVVGMAAVRELYGTVINEGASKGILITTADYGPDAYEFAKGKPLTLLNGGNLLHLLARHGYKAKIDLMEAKQILSEKKP